jgi:hypothetical protein
MLIMLNLAASRRFEHYLRLSNVPTPNAEMVIKPRMFEGSGTAGAGASKLEIVTVALPKMLSIVLIRKPKMSPASTSNMNVPL